MRFGSIRVRLTAWYLMMLALGLGVFGVGSWFAMRASVFHAIEEELADRIRDVKTFLQDQTPFRSKIDIRDELSEHSVLGLGGDLFQICDEQGGWLYRSSALESGLVPIRLPSQVGDQPVYENLTVRGAPVRFATARVVIEGHPYTIQVAEPLEEFYEALERFGLMLWISVPLLLIGAGLGGYLISRRALKPVDLITTAAESISINNLADRLEVPKTSDELQRLSETLNRMLSRLDISVQKMSQLTADASHELRAPVSLIRTTAELAVHEARTNTEYHGDMMQILAEAERTSRLIDSLLLLARADAGEGGLQHELTDVSTSIREAMEQGWSLAAGKRIELTANLNSNPIVVRGDGEALRRLSFILIENAIKYTPEGGRVHVRLEGSHAVVTIEVTDSGIGIVESDQPHIFDRFWRADKVRSRSIGGAGLGLSIARWIVDQHHGSIEVQSQPGQGSTFTVKIPLAEIPAPLGQP
ncbi:MAG: HAMP domain-containing protein [Acidobacteria bacterium]|nr:HAMP domain-containing protein [Acidobacteriota bacterium]